MLLFVTSFGPKLFFADLWNILDIVIISATMFLLVMDIAYSEAEDDDKFRIKGLFRVLRVLLLYRKLDMLRVKFEAHNIHKESTNFFKTPLEKVNETLTYLRNNLHDNNLISDLNF